MNVYFLTHSTALFGTEKPCKTPQPFVQVPLSITQCCIYALGQEDATRKVCVHGHVWLRVGEDRLGNTCTLADEGRTHRVRAPTPIIHVAM